MAEESTNSPRSKKLLLILLGVIFTLIVLEVICRVWINVLAPDETRKEYSLYTELRPEDKRYVPHHYLNYYPNPEYKSGGTYHNSLGYRGDEFPAVKPEGVYRIAVLGGSSAYTTEVDENEKSFTAQLEEILRSEYGYENVRVINAGVGGYTTSESLINLEFRVLDLDPDLVIVYHGTNDVHTRMVDPETYRGDNSGRRVQWHEPSVRFFERSALLRTVLRKTGVTNQFGLRRFVNADSAYGPYNLSGQDPMELLDKNPPVYFKRNLMNMAAVSKANGADIVFSTWAYTPDFDDYASTDYYIRGFTENNLAVKEVGDDIGVTVFDFAGIMPTDREYWADGRHVNEKGARKKAELFAEFLNNGGFIKKVPAPK